MGSFRLNVMILMGFAVAWSLAAALLESFPGDLAISRSLQRINYVWFENLMRFGNFAGNEWLIGGLLAVVSSILIIKRRYVVGLTVVMTGAMYVITPLLKVIIARPRPTNDLISVLGEWHGFGYPSGHAISAALVLGAVIIFAPMLVGKSRLHVLSLRVFASSLILIVSLSRIYFGAHWFSDVIGSILIASFFITCAWYLLRLFGECDGRGPDNLGAV